MIAKYNRLSFVFGVPGIVMQIAGNFQRGPDGLMTLPGAGLVLLGTVLLMIGLAYYAKAKGRSPAWCLMALLSIIGLLVLAWLKDRSTIPLTEEEGHEQA
ncbi:MAG: hypothetical protein EHM35_12395 [Planctomycetaceae bacterium]|nr:MAG: hypothetical protein EHM35_12395 [Planctomycetaceae bacterium]